MNADELMEAADQVREAQQQIAEATATLRHVAEETKDSQRGAVMVAHLEALVGTGGWMALKSETLDGWIEELEESAQEAEAAELFQMARDTR